MELSLIHLFKYNQQDATLHNGIYYYKCSTCFRRFLRPSSGAQKLYTQQRVFVELLLLPTACLPLAVGRSKSSTNTR